MSETPICYRFEIQLAFGLAFGRRILLKPIVVEHDWNVGPRMTPARREKFGSVFGTSMKGASLRRGDWRGARVHLDEGW